MIPGILKIKHLQITPPIVLAPMSGVTDQPFRLIVKEFGAGLMFTEFISSEGVIRKHQKTLKYASFSPEERPIGIQIFGADPVVMAESARFLAERFKPDLIDLNFGCPVKKVVKKGAGAALLKSPKKIEAICRETVKKCPVPVSAKIRSGWDQNSVNVLDIAVRIEDSGVSILTVHPRTASMGYSGKADWKIITQVKEEVSIPVIGNGDIVDAPSARAMFEQTGCDAVMIGRGALGNPWIFPEVNECIIKGKQIPPPSLADKLNVALKHLILTAQLKGNKIASLTMKKHLGWYLKGFPDASSIRRKINMAKSVKEMEEILLKIRELSKP